MQPMPDGTACAKLELMRLAWALEWIEGFGLFFVRCALGVGEPQVADQIRRSIPQPVREVFLQQGEPDPYARIAEAAAVAPPGGVLLIHGLTGLLSSAPEADVWSVSAWLNWRRPDYGALGRPLVFLASSPSLTTLIRNAPDFFDWNSGVYELALQTAEANDAPSHEADPSPYGHT